MYRKLLLAGAVAGSVSAQVMGIAHAEQTKIGVAAEPYPPFSVTDSSGAWSGWEIDIAMAVCVEAKLECVISPIPWDGLIPALQTKKIDLIMSSMSITDERKKTIDFTDKYYNSPAVIVAPKGSAVSTDATSLDGKVIGLQAGTIHAAYAKKHFTSASDIREYQTQDEAFQDLAAGRIDAVEAESIAANAFLRSEQGVACCEDKGPVANDEAVLGSGVGAGIRKDDTALKGKINDAIHAIRADGTYDKISRKYFDIDIYGQ